MAAKINTRQCSAITRTGHRCCFYVKASKLSERRFLPSKWLFVFLVLIVNGCVHSRPSNLASENNCAHDDRNLRCVHYVENYDGDTAKFNVDDVHWLLREKLRIRLIDIDAPEKKDSGGHVRGPCEKRLAPKAETFLRSKLAAGNQIHIVNIRGWDNFGRVLADISVDGVGISALMLERKLAFPYKEVGDWCELERAQQ